MSVSSSHVMCGDCAPVASGTITHDMDGLCRWRHSARLLDARPHPFLVHLRELEMPYDAVLVDEESARQAQHPVTPRRRAVVVEDRLEAIEPERVEKGAR